MLSRVYPIAIHLITRFRAGQLPIPAMVDFSGLRNPSDCDGLEGRCNASTTVAAFLDRKLYSG